MTETERDQLDELLSVDQDPITDRDCHRIPSPTARAGRRALRAILRERSVLPALTVFHEELGDVFQISLGSFRPVFMVGPDAARFVLVTARDRLLWRPEHDPVTQLLRDGLLVTDGEKHDDLRRRIGPSVHPAKLGTYSDAIRRATDRITLDWPTTTDPIDMLVEMRRIALLIVMETLFGVELWPDLDRLIPAILDTIRYISPGLWTVWPSAPRPGYRRSLAELDAYLYQVIADRRNDVGAGDDLLARLIHMPDMSNDLIRDQMITLLIAGHDTSTALLAWTLYLLGKHPEVADRVHHEVDAVVGSETPTLDHSRKLKYMDQVLNETMRLYPPIHIGNRIAATDLRYQSFVIPAGTRVVYSIYLTHRHRAYWSQPHRFDPDRFGAEESRTRAPYSFLPFGGGKRNCIGAAFAQVEAKIVLSRLFQRYDLTLQGRDIHPHMGATLEPRPGVMMNVRVRK
jgi:cytochrome P450